MSKKIKIFLAILVIIIGLGGLYLTMNFKKVLSAVSGVINVSARLAGVSSPVNSNDAATKGYVDAASVSYIVTTRDLGSPSVYSTSPCVDSFGYIPSPYCPSGWTAVTSWWQGDYSGIGKCYAQTLCSK
jgi:hypothetical protein